MISFGQGQFEPRASESPTVTVVIPTRDRGELLQRAINSVVAQTFEPAEIIVVDDASEAGVDLGRLGLDGLVRVVRNPTPLGAQRSRLIGAELATGDFVALLDSDDWWRRDKLERQIALARDRALISCRVVVARGAMRKEAPWRELAQGERVEEFLYVNRGMLQSSTILAKKEILVSLLRQSATSTVHNDTMLFLAAQESGLEILQMRDALSFFDDNPRPDRISYDAARMAASIEWFRHASVDWSIAAKKGYMLTDMVTRYVNTGQRGKAFVCLMSAYHPRLGMVAYAKKTAFVMLNGPPLRFFRHGFGLRLGRERRSMSRAPRVREPRRISEDAATAPSLTIIVPTYNRPVDAQATVDQLRRQPFVDFELWLIDQSDAEIADANARYIEASGDARLHYLRLERKNLPNARNEGLSRARGAFVLFVDDDVVLLARDFIGAHMRAFDDPSVGGVTGRHVERSLRMNARHTACYVSWGGRTIFNLFGTERQEIGSCKGSNMSFRMAAVRQIGGFDRRTHLLEETDFSTRLRAAGWRLMFEPEAELLHLSTAAGGVRDQNALDTECRRFSSTAYYVLKHRGWLGVPSFFATFTLIALMRAARLRSVTAAVRLYAAMFEGFSELRRGPDQLLPAALEGLPSIAARHQAEKL